MTSFFYNLQACGSHPLLCLVCWLEVTSNKLSFGARDFLFESVFGHSVLFISSFLRVVTWRIIPVRKWLGTPIYKPFRPFGRETILRGLTITMVINHPWSPPPRPSKKKRQKNTNHKFYGFGLRLFHLLGFGDVKSWKISGADSCSSNDDILVGGFNPCEKY